MMLGVVVPRLTDTVMAMLYEALASCALQSGRTAIVATSQDEPRADRAAAELLLQRGVDGLILSTARRGDSMVEELAARGVPYVLALRTDGTSRSAVGDDVLGGYLATRHLLDLGHRRIGLIAGPDYASSSRGRQQGYRNALAEAGIDVAEDLVIPSAFSIDAGAEAAEILLALEQRPTAIFAVNDNSAIGALSVIGRHGLTVPGDISLVGYNDIPIVSRLPVPLTTVRVPFDQIASAAIDLLDNVPAPEDRIRVLSPTLIPRKSTATPRF
ncbi:substrate-binding domain-containing protein [Castellaniella sp.]|uniref:substrate-binding domain-containing protein n=1 Tax=Castellaniella sp. TaxID=1955812 RepID=UPI0025BC6B76|nr:substrate-binding domain-containing protein [Castellaniella sp.]